MTMEVLWPDPDIFVPTLPPGVKYVDVHGILEHALDLILPTKWARNISAAPPSSNILFNSMQGLGKTLLAATIAIKLAERSGLKVPMLVYDCSEDSREYHLIGAPTIRPDGSLAFIPGPFTLAIHFANQTGLAVLCAEEISALTPGAQKEFNRMTDWRSSIYIPQLSMNMALKPGCRVVILATMNPSGFGGVFTLNPDLRSRFDEYLVPVPTMEQETKILTTVFPGTDKGLIERACQLAKDSRTEATDYRLSTRDIVSFINNAAKMGDLKVPLTLLANKFEGGDRNLLADRIKATFNIAIPRFEA